MPFDKLSEDEFIRDLILVHGDKYDYRLVKYKNNRTKIKIICPNHGVFEQIASTHKRGSGCSKCRYEENRKNNLIKQSEILKRFKDIHGDRYDYSTVIYKGYKEKIDIICRIHGVFRQIANLHLEGSNCPKCIKNMNFTTEIAIDGFKKIHGDKYDYSLVDYKNNHTPVNIICREIGHGEFSMRPNSHVNGSGCQKCSRNHRFNNEEIISLFNKVHNEKYDYSLVNYKNAHVKVSIICPKHGIFNQTPNHHKRGSGCPVCKASTYENTARIALERLGIKYIPEYRFADCIYKNTLSFDFFLPDYNTCIEINGIQHYEPINYFGGVPNFELNKIRDDIKIKYCKKNNIKLYIIKYTKNITNEINKIINKTILV